MTSNERGEHILNRKMPFMIQRIFFATLEFSKNKKIVSDLHFVIFKFVKNKLRYE